MYLNNITITYSRFCFFKKHQTFIWIKAWLLVVNQKDMVTNLALCPTKQIHHRAEKTTWSKPTARAMVRIHDSESVTHDKMMLSAYRCTWTIMQKNNNVYKWWAAQASEFFIFFITIKNPDYLCHITYWRLIIALKQEHHSWSWQNLTRSTVSKVFHTSINIEVLGSLCRGACQHSLWRWIYESLMCVCLHLFYSVNMLLIVFLNISIVPTPSPVVTISYIKCSQTGSKVESSTGYLLADVNTKMVLSLFSCCGLFCKK